VSFEKTPLSADQVGISAIGWYVPRLRLSGKEWQSVWKGSPSEGVRGVAVPDVDEDVVTMAVEAATRALGPDGAQAVDELHLASTSAPYVVKSTAAVLSSVLFGHAVRSVDHSGSARSVTAALLAARDAVASGRVRSVLVVASDFLVAETADQGESRFGAAAAAVLVDREGSIARFDSSVAGHSTVTSYWQSAQRPTIRRFDDARLERVVEQVAGIRPVASSVAEPGDTVAVHLSQRAAREVLKGVPGVGAVVGGDLYSGIGDAGNGGILLTLLAALGGTAEGEHVCLVAEGSGAGAEAIRFTRGSAVVPEVDVPAGAQIGYTDYLKATRRLEAALPGEVGSSFVASAAWWRTEDMLLRPVAQICRDCGALNYPRRSICIDCRSRALREAPLPRSGSVLSFNIQHVMAVGPEQAPSPIAVAQMDGVPAGGYGGKVSAMVLQEDGDKLAIGEKVRLVFRRAGEELGLVKYGYKFAVVRP
jgi:3-hydroxy-3-methylglutaryl CoA synthase/uncharacterized OB-fold protein